MRLPMKLFLICSNLQRKSPLFLILVLQSTYQIKINRKEDGIMENIGIITIHIVFIFK
jgi:hypothetical protein